MRRRLELHALAERDLGQLAEFIRRQDPRTALRFLRAARATFTSLARMPGMGGPFETDNTDLSGLRCFPVTGFRNHLIFYRVLDKGIEVLRVLHASRDLENIFDPEPE